MDRISLIARVRSITRDLSSSIFREIDITDYINEGIDRIKMVVPEMAGMLWLYGSSDEPILLPQQYHHLLALYSSSRCFGQDERHYQSSNYMNEFEQKLDEMKMKIESGELIIIDPATGIKLVLNTDYAIDFVVTNNYFASRSGHIDYDGYVLPDDVDEGVEGEE
jgi:hypothetical protein